MTDVLNACLRIIAALLLAGGALMAVVAVQADWPSIDLARPIEHEGIAAAAISFFLIGCAAVALAISQKHFRYSAEVRLIGALLFLFQVGAVAFSYAARAA